MRIFHVSQHTPNEIDLPTSRLWHVNLVQPLIDLGHELICFSHAWVPIGYSVDLKLTGAEDRVRGPRSEFGAALFDAVQAEHRRRPIDLFFSYFSAVHIEPSYIKAIRDLGIVTVNWYCNASYQFYLVAPIAAAYDFCLVPEKFRLEDYRKVGANPLYCQEAANPNVYRPHPADEDVDVSFVGACYGSRPLYVDALVRGGVDARVWGPGWRENARAPKQGLRGLLGRARNRLLGRRPAPCVPPERCGPPLSDDELVRMYSKSKVTLGFSAVAEAPPPGQPPIKQVRLRDFEATMSGACYLVEYFEELTEFFEPDREIICFGDETELIEKARFYLAHESARRRIREAGLRRARAEHTWHRRFQQAFREMGVA